MKKLATILALIAILAMVVPVSSQEPGQPFEVTPLSPDAAVVVDAGKAVARAGEAAPAGDLELVSIIVTFDESVDPSALEAASGGRVIHRYKKIFNGASLVLAEDGIDAVAAVPGVTGVYLDEVQYIDTDSSPAFIGAPSLWEMLGGQENAGEGIVVGVLDTGIWPEHPSFSDPDHAAPSTSQRDSYLSVL